MSAARKARQDRNKALMPPPPKVKPSGNQAVMNARRDPVDALDDFPTPPWATRALFVHVLPALGLTLTGRSVWEPAANRGIMASVLAEAAHSVWTSDVHAYGFDLDERGSFIDGGLGLDAARGPDAGADWVATNPPFNLALEFALQALRIATEGVALLCRSNWAEGIERYEQLFQPRPPLAIAQFAERVPMVEGGYWKDADGERHRAHRGGYDPDASTATAYAWFIWAQPSRAKPNEPTRALWIPPCRDLLTQPTDAARFGKIREPAHAR